MKQKVLEKVAAEDAREWGIAQMFFGEGAGTRRRLLGAQIEQKMVDIPGYAEAYQNAFDKLDQTECVEIALAQRKKIDRAAKTGKNLRALKSGNLRGLSTGVYLVVGTGIVLHYTGYDKVLIAEGKKGWKRVKLEWEFQKSKRQGTNVTNLR